MGAERYITQFNSIEHGICGHNIFSNITIIYNTIIL